MSGRPGCRPPARARKPRGCCVSSRRVQRWQPAHRVVIPLPRPWHDCPVLYRVGAEGRERSTQASDHRYPEPRSSMWEPGSGLSQSRDLLVGRLSGCGEYATPPRPGMDEGVRDFRELRARIGAVEYPPRPQRPAQRGERVGEGRRALGGVPGSRLPGRLLFERRTDERGCVTVGREGVEPPKLWRRFYRLSGTS